VAKRNKSLTGLFSNKSVADFITGDRAYTESPSARTTIPREDDLHALSLGAKDTSTGIRFGAPSNPNSGYTSGGVTWTKLLAQSGAGAAASVLGGATGLGALGGLGSLISGIFTLFGGGHATKTLPPLVEFTPPNPITQAIYVNSTRTALYDGTNVEVPLASQSRGPIYTSNQTVSPNLPGVSSTAFQNAQIIQMVKNALLTSSSLNDVISEL
jgi:hypothetical protein